MVDGELSRWIESGVEDYLLNSEEVPTPLGCCPCPPWCPWIGKVLLKVIQGGLCLVTNVTVAVGEEVDAVSQIESWSEPMSFTKAEAVMSLDLAHVCVVMMLGALES